MTRYISNKGGKALKKIDILRYAHTKECDVKYMEDGSLVVYAGKKKVETFREVKK